MKYTGVLFLGLFIQLGHPCARYLTAICITTKYFIKGSPVRFLTTSGTTERVRFVVWSTYSCTKDTGNDGTGNMDARNYFGKISQSFQRTYFVQTDWLNFACTSTHAAIFIHLFSSGWRWGPEPHAHDGPMHDFVFHRTEENPEKTLFHRTVN